MQIKKITQDIYDNFAIQKNQDHFLHSVQWAKTREKIGWTYEILGYYEEDQLLGACVITYKKFPYISKYFSYIPRGFVIDYNDTGLINNFTNVLTDYLKGKKIVNLTIDPDIILNKLDDEYNVVEHFKHAQKAMSNLESAGYKHQGFLNNFEGVQPRHTFRINTYDNSYEDILKLMHRSTRYSINLVSKGNLDVEFENASKLEDFMELMDETTKRDGFTSRDINYYRNIMNEFGDDVKLIFVSINPKKLKEIHIKEQEEISNEITNMHDDNNFEELGKKVKNKVLELKKQLDKAVEKVEKLEPYLEHDKIYLATAFLITYNKKAWYVYGASSDHLREYRPTYLIYKTMIEYCIDNDYEFLDLFGVGGELNPNSHIHGLYVIKKGFGGELVEFIGEYDLIINKSIYKIYKQIYPKMKSLRKKISK